MATPREALRDERGVPGVLEQLRAVSNRQHIARLLPGTQEAQGVTHQTIELERDLSYHGFFVTRFLWPRRAFGSSDNAPMGGNTQHGNTLLDRWHMGGNIQYHLPSLPPTTDNYHEEAQAAADYNTDTNLTETARATMRTSPGTMCNIVETDRRTGNRCEVSGAAGRA